jgi:BlaI family transcriptional regulator, penicillinase repressor
MDLSRRERQIMDVLFQRGKATAAEVQAGIPNAPSYSAVRAMLRTLEEKGIITHVEDGRAYVYRPTIGREQARRSAVKHLLTTFFAGSTEQAVAALLDVNRAKLSDQQLDRLAAMVEEAKGQGR